MQYTVERYGMGGALAAPYAEAVARTRAALAAEGFGIVSELDLAATFKAKLGLERAPYLILGACNPQIASQAIAAEPDLGLLLPCNVVIYEDGGHVWVKAIEPHAMLGVTGNPALDPAAVEVRARLERALAAI